MQHFKTALFINIVLFFSHLHGHSQDRGPIVIPASFGTMEYQITIFDIRPYILDLSGVKHKVDMQKLDEAYKSLSMVGLMFHGKNPKQLTVSTRNIPIKDIIKKQQDGTACIVKDHLCVKGFCERVEKSRSFLSTQNYWGQQNEKYYVDLFEGGGEIKDDHVIKQKDYHDIPSFFCSETCKREHHRHNLFDMITPEVDNYIFDYGIAQFITPNKRATSTDLEITLFAAIETIGKTYPSYRQLVAIQYTFNKEGNCYHCAAKPWTMSHIRYLSNTYTQMAVRAAIKDFYCDAIERKSTNPSCVAFRKFFSASDVVDQINDKLALCSLN